MQEAPWKRKVLAAAEAVNYSDATKLERFNSPSNPEDYGPNGNTTSTSATATLYR